MEGKGSREEATERKKDQENSLREKAPTQFPEDHGKERWTLGGTQCHIVTFPDLMTPDRLLWPLLTSVTQMGS